MQPHPILLKPQSQVGIELGHSRALLHREARNNENPKSVGENFALPVAVDFHGVDYRTAEVIILAGQEIEITIHKNGYWRYT